MGFEPVRAAVTAYFTASFAALHTGTVIALENRKATISQTAAWVQFKVLNTYSSHPHVGEARFVRDIGTAVAEIFAPAYSSGGTTTLGTMADDVRSIFAGATVEVTPAVPPWDEGIHAWFSDSGSMAPRIINLGVMTERGTWLRANVLAPFRCDQTL